MKQLLVEHFPLIISEQLLNENIKNNSKFFVEGIIQRANAKNQNGRIYPKAILEREIQRYKDGPVAERRSFGELDHFETAVVNLKNVSHVITDIWWDGDDVIAKLEILDTPCGNIAKALFKAGLSVGISSRAMGSVESLDEGTVEVQDDLSLSCWDLVSEPSTQGAFVKPLGLNENYNPTQIKDKYSNINKILEEILCNATGQCCLNNIK